MRKISYKALFELERIENLLINDNIVCYWGAKNGATKSSEDYVISFYDELKDMGFFLASAWEFDKYAVLEITEDCPDDLAKIIINNSEEISEKERMEVESRKGVNLIEAVFNRKIIFNS